jgi:hypothetical protein
MDMDQAAVFLAGSVLFALSIVTLVVGCVAVNNIIHKFWKPIKLFTPDSWKGFMPPVQYVEVKEKETK